MNSEYRCHLLNGLPYVDDNPDIPAHSGLQAFAHGFWVDENYHLCLPSDDKYWIPPSAIKQIEKLEK